MELTTERVESFLELAKFDAQFSGQIKEAEMINVGANGLDLVASRAEMIR
jgi:hypothetical protein